MLKSIKRVKISPPRVSQRHYHRNVSPKFACSNEATFYHEKAHQFCSGFPKELDAETLQVVHATAPAVAQNISAITKVFYGIMLEKYPVTKTLFNPSHFLPEEETGRTPQSVALGEAIVKGCGFLNNLSGFKDSSFLELSAQKHCAMHVQAEHYPIVYECFMEAVAQVLGAAVTPEVGAAWSKVVLYQARAYIEREAEIYKSVSSGGGWMGFKQFKVSVVKKETSNSDSEITSYTFVPVDGLPLPDFRPGSYIAIRLPNVGSAPSHLRTYSLADVSNRKSFTIAVKTEKGKLVTHNNKSYTAPDGVFSTLMTQRLQAGVVVDLSAPFGNFTLPDSLADPLNTQPIVLLAGGIGVTPVLAMLKTLIQNGSRAPTYLLYAVANSSSHAFDDEFQRIAREYPHVTYHVVYSEAKDSDLKEVHYDSQGFLSADLVKSVVGANAARAHYFVCGDPIIRPCVTFLKDMGIPDPRVRFEYFGPLGTGMRS